MAAFSNIERLRVPTPEEALIFKRSSATDSAHSIIGKGRHGQELLPQCLLDAFECEAWKDRKTPNGAAVCNADFMEWVTAPYPRGLGTTPEIVRAILTSSPEAGKAQQALLLWDRATRRPVGSNQHCEGFDNVQALPLAPTGNTVAAGMRRLDREAEKGNDAAARALQAVKSGAMSVHRAMVECGFRKGIDPEVKALAAAEAAEMAINMAEGDYERLRAFELILRKAGAKNVADQIANRIDPAIMDGAA